MKFVEHQGRVYGLIRDTEVDRWGLVDPETNKSIKIRTRPEEITGEKRGYAVKISMLISGKPQERTRKYLAGSEAEARARAMLAGWKVPDVKAVEVLAVEHAEIEFSVTMRASASDSEKTIKISAPTMADAERQARKEADAEDVEIIKTDALGV